MEVRRIVDPSFDANLYLILAERCLLIDAGTGRLFGAVRRKLDEVLGKGRLDHFILTHRHVDHAGGAVQISEAYGVVPMASVDEAPALMEADGHSTGALLFGLQIRPMRVLTLRYGERIDLGDVTFEVIHTPGHTIGSICLMGDDGSLFSGDTVFAYGGIGRWDMDTGSFHDLVSSLKQLEALEVERLYPGHGPAVERNASEHISMALEMAEAYRL